MAPEQINLSRPPSTDRLAMILHLPLPEGAAAADEPVMAGTRAVYLLARDSNGNLETPFVPASEQSAQAALPVFSTREAGVLYMQVARWDDYKLQAYSPRELGRWAEQLAQKGIRFLMVDPNRHDQARGIEQPVIDLETLGDFSGENLYEEIRAVGQG
jgi:hypothetical protein